MFLTKTLGLLSGQIRSGWLEKYRCFDSTRIQIYASWLDVGQESKCHRHSLILKECYEDSDLEGKGIEIDVTQVN